MSRWFRIERGAGRGVCIAGLCLALAVAAGCKGAAARCAEAQVVAASAWRAYADAMSKDLAAAEGRLKEIQGKMRGDIDRRLTGVASKEADRLNRPGTVAWHRTYAAHLQAACSDDKECSELRIEQRNLEAKVESLKVRIERATKASSAASLEREAAKASVDAIEDDFDYSQIKPARAASGEAHEMCEGISPEDLVGS